jgi:hypothetical protein
MIILERNMKKRMIVTVILTFMFLSMTSSTILVNGLQISKIISVAPSYILTINKSFLFPRESNKNIIWDNFSPNSGSTALSSQLDIIYPFNSQVADDIMVTNNTQVTGVHWWGAFFGGDPPWPNPCDFNIIFYADDGSGNRPTGAGMDDPTPTALAVYFFPDVTGIPSEPYDSYWYQVNLTQPFNFTSDTKYWIAIQAVLICPPQWGWWSNGDNPDQLHLPVQGFPEVYVQYWTDLDPWYGGDMAFYLTGYLNVHPSPPVIHGPTDGVINVDYTFWTDPVTDSSGDSLYCRWDWDDGNITEWLGPYPSGSTIYASHVWEDAGVYDIRAKLKGTGGESNWSEPLTITVVQNQPPSTPLITGPLKGKPGITYNYEFIATDSEGENISYYVDWGDGTNTGWIGPYPSGQEQIMNHTWTKKGTYTIKAKARDIHDQESDWGSLSVIMPYEPPHYRFFEWLFERFPHAFPLLRYILNY